MTTVSRSQAATTRNAGDGLAVGLLLNMELRTCTCDDIVFCVRIQQRLPCSSLYQWQLAVLSFTFLYLLSKYGPTLISFPKLLFRNRIIGRSAQDWSFWDVVLPKFTYTECKSSEWILPMQWVKETGHLILAHNFRKCWPTSKILSPSHLAVIA